MIVLEFNPKIKSKTTFEVPILYGTPQFDKKKLFSHTVFEDRKAKEVRFSLNEICVSDFDENNFITGRTIYLSDNTIKEKTIFKFEDKDEEKTSFRDSTPGNGGGNTGILRYLPDENIWRLSFGRVSSFLGYKKYVILTSNDAGDFIKEEHYTWEKKVLEKCLINEYEYFENTLHTIAENILANGWNLSEKVKNYLESEK